MELDIFVSNRNYNLLASLTALNLPITVAVHDVLVPLHDYIHTKTTNFPYINNHTMQDINS